MKNRYINFRSDAFKILFLFILWKFILCITLLYGIKYITLGNIDRFLGGGPANFSIAPQLFSWANFDGEHYLAIAMNGYKPLEQAFFPLYPLLISILAKPFIFHSNIFLNIINSTIVGLLVSNISFFLSLLVLYKLIIIDFSRKIALLTIIMLLIFPTSFYFGALYSESLFLLLTLLAFLSARKKNWILAGIFGGLASATRIFGILLFFSFLIEAYQQKEKFKKWFWILLIPSGLIFYMLYQFITVGDPLAFYNLQVIVGQQHQTGIILLPQVYFRYTKMLLTTNMHNSLYQTILLEFLSGILFFLLPIIGFFKKVRFSYLVFALFGFMIPTIQGSFSSTPRYVLVLFPSFLVSAILFTRLNLIIKFIVIISFGLCLAIESLLFFRGYWVA